MTDGGTSFVWTVPGDPLRWVTQPSEIADWRLLGPFWWQRYVSLQLERGEATLENLIPKSLPENYPRLIREPEPGAIYFERRATAEAYLQLARVLPDFMNSGDTTLRLTLANILPAAARYGMLFEPQYGDSAFAWVASSLRFQVLQRIWHAISQANADYGDRYFHSALKNLIKRYRDIVVELDTGTSTLNIRASEIPSPINLVAYHDPDDLPSSMDLRASVETWLVSELSDALTTYGSSETYFTIVPAWVAEDDVCTQYRPEVDQPAHAGMTPYFCIKCGLYAFAIYDFFMAFRKGGALNQCEGCGKVFLPPRKTQKYCPQSNNRCRKRAQRSKLSKR